jgi:hypothetical protein
MKTKNFLISLLITLTAACIVFLLFYPSGSPLGNLFDSFFILIIMHYAGIGYGILVLLSRILKFLRNNSLLYLLAGTLNIFLALIGFFLFAFHLADMEWLHKCIGNLAIGFFIFSDVFILGTEINR